MFKLNDYGSIKTIVSKNRPNHDAEISDDTPKGFGPCQSAQPTQADMGRYFFSQMH